MKPSEAIEKYFLDTRKSDPSEYHYFEGDPYDEEDMLTDNEAKLLSEWEELTGILLRRRWYEPNYDAKTAAETREEANHVYLTLK